MTGLGWPQSTVSAAQRGLGWPLEDVHGTAAEDGFRSGDVVVEGVPGTGAEGRSAEAGIAIDSLAALDVSRETASGNPVAVGTAEPADSVVQQSAASVVQQSAPHEPAAVSVVLAVKEPSAGERSAASEDLEAQHHGEPNRPAWWRPFTSAPEEWSRHAPLATVTSAWRQTIHLPSLIRDWMSGEGVGTPTNGAATTGTGTVGADLQEHRSGAAVLAPTTPDRPVVVHQVAVEEVVVSEIVVAEIAPDVDTNVALDGASEVVPDVVTGALTHVPAEGVRVIELDALRGVDIGPDDTAGRVTCDPDTDVTPVPPPGGAALAESEAVAQAAEQEPVTPTPPGQSAPDGVDREKHDGSTGMQDYGSTVDGTSGNAPGVGPQENGPGEGRPQWQPPGAPLAPPMTYNDSDRVELVESLPQVDESTPLAAEVAEDARRRITLVGRPFPQPPHTRVLTVANQKGGVGKTTTTVNVAAAMAQAGLNVLVLDIDPQGNASTALGIDHHAEVPSLYDVVVEDRPLAEVLQPCPDIENLWCAPATIDLAGAEIELVSLVAREVRLKKALATYLNDRRIAGLPQIDYVFIDCPPSLSLLTINAFVAAQEVFIPIQCEYYALEGLSQLLKHIDLIRGHLNPELHVSTILLTMYDGRTRLSSQVADEVREHFSEIVLKTSVPRSVRISEAPSHMQTVMTYDPASSGALSYLEASRELAEQVLAWSPMIQKEQV